MTPEYEAHKKTGICNAGELTIRSNYLFQHVDGIYMHLQIETPKLSRESIV